MHPRHPRAEMNQLRPLRSDLPSLQLYQSWDQLDQLDLVVLFRLAESNRLFIHIPRCLGLPGVKKNQYQFLNRNAVECCGSFQREP